MSEIPPAVGSIAAAEEVRELGLPLSFAGTKSTQQIPFVSYIEPVASQSDLRLYQQELLQRAMQYSMKGQASLVNLPTGAGKTRIGVELVAQYLSINTSPSLHVWVAPTQILCEQGATAIQKRLHANRNHGVSVIRVWGKNASKLHAGDLYDYVSDPNCSNVIITTPESLLKLLQNDGVWQKFVSTYDGLGSFVIDEAHGAVAPTYLTILDRLKGVLRSGQIGLSATPMRSSDAETEKLHRLFQNNILTPLETFGTSSYRDICSALVNEGYLSELVFEQVGSALNPDLDWESISKNAVEILDRDPNSKVLVFTQYVATAKAVAFGINRSRPGCADAIWGELSSPQQTEALQNFKLGKIKVLVNSDLLVEGADVPGITHLIVAKPTKSLTQFLQIIGRGARGPKSGGVKQCRIKLMGDYEEVLTHL